MDLIERYVHQVGLELPKRQREDVENELRSLLQDMVEDRAQTKVEYADEEIVVAVLREFGRPYAVAVSYREEKQDLIAAELFPIFKFVVKFTTAVFSLWMLFGVTVATVGSAQSIGAWVDQLLAGIPEFADFIFWLVGLIAVVFSILGWIFSKVMGGDFGEWDPRKLPKVNDPAQVDQGRMFLRTFFVVVFLFLLNVNPEWVGVFLFNEEGMYAVPLLSANFYDNLLPWVNLLLIATFLLNLPKLVTGYKTTAVRWLEVGKDLLMAVVAGILLMNSPVFGLSPELVILQGWSASNPVPAGFSQLIAFLNVVILGVLLLIIIGRLFSAGRKGKHLLHESDENTDSELVGKMG